MTSMTCAMPIEGKTCFADKKSSFADALVRKSSFADALVRKSKKKEICKCGRDCIETIQIITLLVKKVKYSTLRKKSIDMQQVRKTYAHLVGSIGKLCPKMQENPILAKLRNIVDNISIELISMIGPKDIMIKRNILLVQSNLLELVLDDYTEYCRGCDKFVIIDACSCTY